MASESHSARRLEAQLAEHYVGKVFSFSGDNDVGRFVVFSLLQTFLYSRNNADGQADLYIRQSRVGLTRAGGRSGCGTLPVEL